MTLNQVKEMITKENRKGIVKLYYIERVEQSGRNNYWDMHDCYLHDDETFDTAEDNEFYLNYQECRQKFSNFYNETLLHEEKNNGISSLQSEGYRIVEEIYDVQENDETIITNFYEDDFENTNYKDEKVLDESNFKFEVCDTQDNVISIVSNIHEAYSIYLEDRYNYHIECCGIVLVEPETNPID